ncbi:MAG: NAD(P)-binding domain-containing protein [Candidatus Acidiferrales bacterium]
MKPPAKNIVFLGGGRITSALIAGLRCHGLKTPLVAHDRHPEKMRKLRRRFSIHIEPNLHRAVASARMLIIAVRPASMNQLLQSIGQINRPMLAVSLAAGIALAKLRRSLGPNVKWARAMPSPACRTGHGLTAIVFDRGLRSPEKSEIRTLFAKAGSVIEIPEKKFDVFTVVYSASHGYYALAALSSAAMKLGLDRKTALVASAHALADAIESWRSDPTPLDALIREAATPGGIAAATMAALNAGSYGRILQRGVRAGLRRARSLGRS